jgi:hypothetical protein
VLALAGATAKLALLRGLHRLIVIRLSDGKKLSFPLPASVLAPRPMSGQVPLEVAELHPERIRSSCSLRPAATLASSSSGASMRRRASMTLSRAS